MIHIAINIILFICIVLTYALLSISLIFLITMLLGLLIGIIALLRKLLVNGSELPNLNYLDMLNTFKKNVTKDKDVRKFMIMQIILSMIAYSVYLLIHFKFNLWTNRIIYIWENPFLFLILYVISIIGAGQTNLFGRPLAKHVWSSIIPICVLTIIGHSMPQVISLWVLKWGIATSFILPIFQFLFKGKSVILNMEKFQDLKPRQQSVRKKLDELLQLINVIGFMGESKEVKNFIVELDKKCKTSGSYIDDGKFRDAEKLLIPLEIELTQNEEKFKQIIEYSLKDEIISKLTQILFEVRRLREEFHLVLISTKNLDKIESEIKTSINETKSINISFNNYQKYLQLIENFITSVSMIKSGLSLRKNAGFQVEKIKFEIDESSLILTVAEELELKHLVNHCNILKIDVLKYLDDLLKKNLTDADELIEIYKNLDQSRKKFMESIVEIKVFLSRDWNLFDMIPSKLFMLIPKYCRTDKVANGILVLRRIKNIFEPNKLTIDGLLIEVKQKQNTKRIIKDNKEFIVACFYFVGERAGLGKIILDLNRLKHLSNTNSCSIKVLPKSMQLFTESLKFAVPFQAPLLLMLLGIGNQFIKDYVALTGALGVLLSIIVFCIRYIKLKV